MTQYIAHLIKSIGQLTVVKIEVCFNTVFLTTRNILRGDDTLSVWDDP